MTSSGSILDGSLGGPSASAGRRETPTAKTPGRVLIFDHHWFWRSRLGNRKGQRCRVLARGRLNTVLVEFEDGYRVTTSRYAVRRVRSNGRDADGDR